MRVESPSTADEAGLPGSMPPKDKLAPEALGALAGAEIAKWWPLINAANVKVD